MARTLSTQAAAAKAIRAELKQAFPGVTFKVTSDSFSGGDSVDVRWTDGPTTAQVGEITSKYQYGHFDGMIDLYEYSNKRTDIPQSKYVHCHRDIGHEALSAAVTQYNARWGRDLRVLVSSYGGAYIDRSHDEALGNCAGWASDEVYRELQKTSLLCRTCQAATLPGDTFCPQCGTRLTCTICHEALPAHPVPERHNAVAHIDCALIQARAY